MTILTDFHQEEEKSAHWENDKPIYSSEKADEDIINEKPFSWIELVEDFSVGAKKWTKTDGSEVEIDDFTILCTKTVDFLNPDKSSDYAFVQKHTSS